MRNLYAIGLVAAGLLFIPQTPSTAAAEKEPLRLMDVFDLEFASDPQVSPDGKRIVYVRHFMDVMKDRGRSNLWLVNANGTGHEPLTSGKHSDSSPRWSPDGTRILYLSDRAGKPQLFCTWLESGRTAQLTDGSSPPLGPTWSPDGKQVAFVMRVLSKPKPFAEMPAKPKGAEWAPPVKVIRELTYRFDGKGYLAPGHLHIFVVPAEGGTPRQVTSGPYNHAGPVWAADSPSWTPDGKSLVFSANRRPGGEYETREAEVYEVSLATGKIKRLTNRRGPDVQPIVSPDGKHIAYLGYDDKHLGYQVTRLYVMNRNGKESRVLTAKLDRSVRQPVWAEDGKGLYFLHDDQGRTRIGFVSLAGEVRKVAADVGGTTIGRPYASGSFSAAGGTVAFTQTDPHHPAEVAVISRRADRPRQVTDLNADLLGRRALAEVEEIRYPSSHDGRKVQAWLAKPPDFDPNRKYPLILEIHGGPFANYGPRFSMEIQLYAGAGYVVLYVNPRGSTSYGQDFANLIHHKYPGNDYDDLMTGVDAVVKRGFIDRDNLFVTGGSGGGILTAWIVGKTDRFRAAVSAKPIINWYSAALTTDIYPMMPVYWFPGPPWSHAEHYLKRSPLSLVGNVKTPTMLMTGEEDHRTPSSEAEQFYQALKLRKVDTALVRIPGASHHIVARPSRLIAKVAHVLKWFEIHRAEVTRGEKAGE